jgi:hypothetical protein
VADHDAQQVSLELVGVPAPPPGAGVTSTKKPAVKPSKPPKKPGFDPNDVGGQD